MAAGMGAQVLEVDVSVDPDTFRENISDIIRKLRPQWTVEELKVEELLGGTFNTVYKLSSPSQTDDIIAVKVFAAASAILVNHTAEYSFLQYLTEHTDLLQVYCKFTNGYMFKYFPGRQLEVTDLTSDAIRRKVYEKLHQLHATDIPQTPGTLLAHDSTLYYLHESRRILHSDKARVLDADERVTSAGYSHKFFREFVDKTITEYKEFKTSHPHVICHGDPRRHNIIMDERSGEVQLIDWDLVGVAPEIMDLCIFMSRDPDFSLRDSNLLPTQCAELLDESLRMYLETHPRYQGHDAPGQEVFRQWKRSLIWALKVVQMDVTACIATAMHVAFDELNFDGIGMSMKALRDRDIYINMLHELDDSPHH